MSGWWFLLISIFIGGLLKWIFDYLTDKVRIVKFIARVFLKIFHFGKKKLKKREVKLEPEYNDLVDDKKEELD